MSFVLELPGPTQGPGPVIVEVTDSQELVIHNYDPDPDEAAAALGLTPSPVYLIAAFEEDLRRANTLYQRVIWATKLMKQALQHRRPSFVRFLSEDEARDYLIDLNELGLIELLVELGADPHAAAGDFGEARPLDLMAGHAIFGAVRALVEHGADVTYNDNRALYFAIPEADDPPHRRQKAHKIVKYLLDQGADEGALGWSLHNAVLSRDEVLVDMLFRYGADPCWLEQLAFKEALKTGYKPVIDRFMQEFRNYEKKGYVRTTFPERDL
jgi:hypothetical protein